jgi:hypothetical protein
VPPPCVGIKREHATLRSRSTQDPWTATAGPLGSATTFGGSGSSPSSWSCSPSERSSSSGTCLPLNVRAVVREASRVPRPGGLKLRREGPPARTSHASDWRVSCRRLSMRLTLLWHGPAATPIATPSSGTQPSKGAERASRPPRARDSQRRTTPPRGPSSYLSTRRRAVRPDERFQQAPVSLEHLLTARNATSHRVPLVVRVGTRVPSQATRRSDPRPSPSTCRRSSQPRRSSGQTPARLK